MAGTETRSARFLAAAPALGLLAHGLGIGPKYDRYVLPAFDGFVYDAMAETPWVFTLAPWGYRILTPWVVHFLPASSPAVGFFWLNLALLFGITFAVGAWLRRLGFTPVGAFLGGASLAATPPFGAMLEYQVLVDPMSLAIFVATLGGFVAPRGLPLAALFALGALTKEVCLLPLAALPFVLSPRLGFRRALGHSFAIATPAVALFIVLRATWGSASLPGDDLVSTAVKHALSIPWEHEAFFAIATLVGLRGFLRESSMEIRATALLLWFGGFGAALANPYGFTTPDLLRIAPFAWTPFLPLILAGLGFRREVGEHPSAQRGRVLDGMAMVAMLVAGVLVSGTDPYRRAVPSQTPDPVSFLARSRETLKTARALNDGQTFAFDSGTGRFAGPILERFNLTEGRRHRWFLFEGFGADAAFQAGSPEFRGEARLLLPIMTPRPVTMSIDFEGPEDAAVIVSASGRDIVSLPVRTPGNAFEIPGAALFRGDNVLRLRGPQGVALRLVRFEAKVLETASPRD